MPKGQPEFETVEDAFEAGPPYREAEGANVMSDPVSLAVEIQQLRDKWLTLAPQCTPADLVGEADNGYDGGLRACAADLDEVLRRHGLRPTDTNFARRMKALYGDPA